MRQPRVSHLPALILFAASAWATILPALAKDKSVPVSTTIKIVAPKDHIYATQNYYVDLINLTLEKSRPRYGDFSVTLVDSHMYQARQFLSLEKGRVDIMWSMTDSERERQALPIRIPLLKGLCGFRVLAINAGDRQRFANVSSLEDLAPLLAGQGHDWPDVRILEHNNLRVHQHVKFGELYKLLGVGRLDYFPRNIVEVWHELEVAEEKNVVLDSHNLLIYPAPVYFFVRKSDRQLAERIEHGLRLAIADGSLDDLIIRHPSHSDFIRRIQIAKRRPFYLENPLLPKETPLGDPSLWFTVQQLIELERRLTSTDSPRGP